MSDHRGEVLLRTVLWMLSISFGNFFIISTVSNGQDITSFSILAAQSVTQQCSTGNKIAAISH